jgi:aromatic ring-opening dioxygenase catalytic subunit (LigB family)
MLLASVVTPHSPKLIGPDVPDYAAGILAGAQALGTAMRALRPDLLVVQSSHWATPFLWFVSAQARHRGICRDPDASRVLELAYDRPGDPLFARTLIDLGREDGLPIAPGTEREWDYGSAVPLQTLDPDGSLPVVLLSTCLNSTLDEGLRIGALIRRTAEATARRVVFVASTAFAARMVRGPQLWPPEAAVAADRHLLKLIADGEIGAAKTALPAYAEASNVEMGARPLATFLGCLDEGLEYRGERFGEYGPIGGSGHVSIAATANHNRHSREGGNPEQPRDGSSNPGFPPPRE